MQEDSNSLVSFLRLSTHSKSNQNKRNICKMKYRADVTELNNPNRDSSSQHITITNSYSIVEEARSKILTLSPLQSSYRNIMLTYMGKFK